MQNYEYIGCFFDYDELSRLADKLRSNKLINNKPNPHVTFEYKPAKAYEELFGTPVSVTIIGYGNNGKNEGLKVTLSSDNPVLDALIKKIQVPHITLAVSDTGQAVNTRYLDFSEISPLKITGVFGGHIE